MKHTVTAALLAMAAFGASAQGYLGASAGASEFNVDCTGATTCSTSGSGMRAYAGYLFNRYWGVELGYISLGEQKSSGMAYGYAAGSYYYAPTFVSYTLTADGWTAAVVGRLPFNPTFAGVGRVGLAKISTKIDRVSNGYGATYSANSDLYPYAGLGLEVTFYKGLKGTASIDMTQFGFGGGRGEKGNVALMSLGLQYGF
jgi:OOP family OmpA-OmpF porin